MMPWKIAGKRRVFASALSASVAAACAGPALPDPRVTAAEYGRAAAKQDAHVVYGLMTDEARRAYGEEGTKRLIADSRDEIAREARGFASADAKVRAEATVPYVDGEQAVLVLESGRYSVSAAVGLPTSPRTPLQALSDLKGALARRSYSALMRVLSKGTRAAVDRDVAALVSGLESPESLDVKIHGDAAEVIVPGGHKVRLVREAGVWRVFDFD